jgi:arylsulfatase A-like enzyme
MMPTTDWAIKNGEWKYIIQAYLACISFVDHQVGIVVSALEKSTHKENTIIVLWSDHGYEIGEKGNFGKHTLWSESTRVPLMIKLPGMKGGKKINNPVELLDLYPTLLEVTNLPKNPLNEGKSLVSLINGKTEDSEPAITTYGMNNHSLINQTHRYIRYEDGSEELYDLINDPNERNNIANQDGSNIIKRNFIRHIPSLNEPWSPSSYNTVNDYFARTSNSEF